MLRLHFNKSNGIFSVRRIDRSTVAATGKRSEYRKLPLIGIDPFELSPNVHALVTRGLMLKAQEGKRPEVPVVVTKWPRVRLYVQRFKEMLP